MKIALVGGTGDIGHGFAMRWAPLHQVVVGSRKAEKAMESVEELNSHLGSRGSVSGADNGSAVAQSDLVVLCVPYEHLASVTSDLSGSYTNQLVISPVVPMSYNGKYFQFTPPSAGSAAVEARSLLPSSVKLVSAFHTICAAALQDLDRTLKGDIMICGDDKDAKDLVAGLVREVQNMRPLDAGPLEASSMVESLTPMLLNVARRNKLKEAGINIIQERAP
jgi:8-hydroxy-5-deazaflavin:NADPH oxidoreductase